MPGNKYACKKWKVSASTTQCRACGRKNVPCLGLSIEYQYGVSGVSSWEPLCFPCIELINHFLEFGEPDRDFFPPYNEHEAITYGHVRKSWYDDWM